MVTVVCVKKTEEGVKEIKGSRHQDRPQHSEAPDG